MAFVVLQLESAAWIFEKARSVTENLREKPDLVEIGFWRIIIRAVAEYIFIGGVSMQIEKEAESSAILLLHAIAQLFQSDYLRIGDFIFIIKTSVQIYP